MPKNGESLAGYLLRLTELNHYDTTSWIMELAKFNNRMHKSFAFVFNSSLDLAPLSLLSGVDIDVLGSLKYPAIGVSRYAGNYLLYNSPVHQFMIRTWHPKICPQCLREESYCRKIWEFSLITACPIHQCILLDTCPGCGKQISWIRKKISVCLCAYDWRDFCAPKIADSALMVSTHIYRLCNLLAGDASRASLSTSNPLSSLELQSFSSALLFIAGQLNGVMDTKGKHLDPSLRSSELHSLLGSALSIFEEWPKQYFSFLDWKRTQVKGTRRTSGARNEFGQYKFALYRSLASTDFDFLREAYEKYLNSHWDGGYINNNNRRLSKSALEDKKYASRNEARKMLAVGAESIEKLINKGILKAVVHSLEKSRLILIEMASIQEFKVKFGQSIFLPRAAELLQITLKRTMELVSAGLLNPLRGPAVDGRSDLKFSCYEIEDLVNKVKSKVPQNSSTKNRGTLKLVRALKKISFIGISTDIFIRDILEGNINPCGKGKDAGLACLLFTEQELSVYMGNKLRNQVGDHAFNLEEAAKIIGAPEHVVGFFVKQGIIPARKYVIGGRVYTLINKQSIDFFESSYILSSRLAQRLRTDSSYLAKLLMNQGIQPISGKNVDGGLRYVFKRSEVESLDLASLLAVSKAQSISRYKERSIVDVDQAAHLLGISRKELVNLVERGILKLHNRLDVRRYTNALYFFSLYTIEKYRGRLTTYADLVSTQAAAGLLKVSGTKLYTNYIRKGKLRVALREGKRGAYYFKQKDVNALAKAVEKLERQTMRSPEVAEILSVNPTTIHKWTSKGILRPVSGPHVDGAEWNLYLRRDIDKLKVERMTFKGKCEKQGKTSRYRRPHSKMSLLA